MPETARRQLIPRWVTVAQFLPKGGREALALLVALRRFASGLLFYDSAKVAKVIREALGIGRISSYRVLFGGEINLARSDMDFADFEKISPENLRSWAQRHVSVRDLANFASALERHPSLILLSTSFAAHYYGLVAQQTTHLPIERIIVLQPNEALRPLQEIGFYDKIRVASGRRIETIAADSPYAMLKAIKLLRKGGVAVARFDSLPTETNSFLLAKMFGVETAFPSNLLRMAQMTKAAILPIFIYREDGAFVTRIGKPVSVSPTAGGAELQAAATAISEQVEEEIALRPAEYTAWPGYHDKVRLAREIRLELRDELAATDGSPARSPGLN